MTITKYTHSNIGLVTRVDAITEDGERVNVAAFDNNEGGKFAFGCFVDGLARDRAAPSLFNEDTGEYTVGTMGELVG